MTHYDISGPKPGEIVVLVHGNATPYFSWDKNMDALTGAGFRVIRYDLYGFGYSDRPDVDYTRALYDRQLMELLEKLNISCPFNLVGTSQGGSIAVCFTATHPEKVKKLALLSPFINILPIKAIITLIKMQKGISVFLLIFLIMDVPRILLNPCPPNSALDSDFHRNDKRIQRLEAIRWLSDVEFSLDHFVNRPLLLP